MPQSPVQEFPLQGIPGGAKLAAGGLCDLPVQLRSDILPAGKEKPIAEIHEPGDVRRQRQDDRNVAASSSLSRYPGSIQQEFFPLSHKGVTPMVDFFIVPHL